MAGHNTTLGGGGFHHIAVRVADIDRSLQLYTQGLGFTEKIRWGEKNTPEGDKRAVLLDTGDGNYLELFAGGPTPPRAPASPYWSDGPIIHIAVRTADVVAATERAQAAGFIVTVPVKEVTIPSAPYNVPIRISFVQGLDGELIELFQNQLT